MLQGCWRTHGVCAGAGADKGPIKGGILKLSLPANLRLIAFLGIFCRMGCIVLVEFLMLVGC